MTTIPSQNDTRPALLWEPDPSPLRGGGASRGAVKCQLCAHRCRIRPGKLGICGVRVNVGGELRTRVYGMATSLAVDPVEKKPLYHFFPGARALSLATVGCNFSCKHCQNHEISQWARHRPADAAVPGRFIPPEEVVEAAEESGSKVIAYTYSEPTIFMEYALDIARLAAPRGLQNVFVTNGFMTEEAVELVAPYLHGANVDLKGMDDRMLRRETKSHSGPVRRTIADLHRRGDRPWHVSRFHPMHLMPDRPATPPDTLESALRIGEAAGLRHVYAGNLHLPGGEDTRCPGCGVVVIERRGFLLGRLRLEGGRCTSCGQVIAGRGLP